MASTAFTVHHYRGCYAQHLRNVSILTPSLIWVRSGKKCCHYQGKQIDIQGKRLLLTRAHEKLTFVNIPESHSFSSIQFCFLLPPEQTMLAFSHSHADHTLPYLDLTPPLQETLSVLSTLSAKDFSQESQKYWLYALYQQLAEIGKLHILFPDTPCSLAQQVSEYLQQQPDKPHQIEQICPHLGMSKSTLIRRLKAENTAFREILLNVRLNHAVGLMQEGATNQLDIALACGYQSQERFSQQFSKTFGLSPRQYLNTLEK
ncbi:helix-turn-helix transcriptional regulator [Vibrio mangrovi]|uniref:AraC family transcriptional regulator n=1 Tax=Vibrio mangrovi TaxID=474394 RepID=A0A1Y6IV32_9VIBR|nr:AraC family transcriptional regulator [Vibrio mangrovi]MDW6001300.1 AraC family transcriptional regulator [Vibrio mangrovi]SMS00680.1 HTH-type transcriptional regulator YdeO [Vibrio mangrovi]